MAIHQTQLAAQLDPTVKVPLQVYNIPKKGVLDKVGHLLSSKKTKEKKKKEEERIKELANAPRAFTWDLAGEGMYYCSIILKKYSFNPGIISLLILYVIIIIILLLVVINVLKDENNNCMLLLKCFPCKRVSGFRPTSPIIPLSPHLSVSLCSIHKSLALINNVSTKGYHLTFLITLIFLIKIVGVNYYFKKG